MKFTFERSAMTCNGKTFPVSYSITPDKTVFVFAETGDQKIRIRFPVDHADYSAAYAAALEAREARRNASTAAAERPETISDASSTPQVEQPAADRTTETVAPQTVEATGSRSAIPEKTFIGDSINGKGWTILFDGNAGRTRVIFEDKPTDAARAAVEKAGFFFSAVMNSWNKKLTFRAYRAAQALSGELSALYA